MNRLLISALAAAMLLIPLPVKAASDASSKAPPVSQNLVREGDFAVKLAAKLKLSNTKNEAEAESALVKAGIAPKNGWVSDYPVTPVIMGQVQTSVKVSANAGRITLRAAEADRAVVGLGSELGVAVVATAPAGARATATAAYAPPEADVDDYYEDEGPPVVTYYAPPPDYYYLYDWDPWPFWWGGFWFPGFFVLADFDFVVVANRPGFVVVGGNTVILAGGVFVTGANLVVTNHAIDPVTRTTVKIGPSGTFVKGTSAWHGNAVNTASAPRPASLAGLSRSQFVNKVSSGKGQAAILNRSVSRQGATTRSIGTRATGGGKAATTGTGAAGAVSKGRSAGTSATARERSATGNIGPSHGSASRETRTSRGSAGPTMGERPSGGSRSFSSGSRPSGGSRSFSGGSRPSGSPRMGGGGGGCRGKNC